MGKKGTGFVPCTTCGGSGATTVNEIYMMNGKPKTRVVRKTCTQCGGKGGYHV